MDSEMEICGRCVDVWEGLEWGLPSRPGMLYCSHKLARGHRPWIFSDEFGEKAMKVITNVDVQFERAKVGYSLKAWYWEITLDTRIITWEWRVLMNYASFF